jgi:hypothetical protein
MRKAKSYGRDLPLQFATWQMIMQIVGAPKGVKTWHCPLPNHPDKDPSFSAAPGREPGTTVVACSCGQREELLDHFRKLGYRLGPMPPLRTPPRRQPRPVIDTTSIAWRALTPSERRIYEQVKASDDSLAYTDFVEAGISSSAISVGLRALQALGFLSVKRSPRRKGCRRYERNLYQIERGWLRYEPERASKAAKAEALKDLRSVARAARKGGEDISQQASPDTSKRDGKTEASIADLRIPVPRASTSDSGGVTYVGEEYSSMTQDSSRPVPFKLGTKGRGGSTDARPVPPPSQAGDPRCDDYACRKGCVRPGSCLAPPMDDAKAHADREAAIPAAPDGDPLPDGTALSERAALTLIEMVRPYGFRIEGAMMPELRRLGYVATGQNGGIVVTARGEAHGRSLLRRAGGQRIGGAEQGAFDTKESGQWVR